MNLCSDHGSKNGIHCNSKKYKTVKTMFLNYGKLITNKLSALSYKSKANQSLDFYDEKAVRSKQQDASLNYTCHLML